jgi:hypothetical protein
LSQAHEEITAARADLSEGLENMHGAKLLAPTLFNSATDASVEELGELLGVASQELREHLISSRLVYETTKPKKRNPSQYRVTAVITAQQLHINRIINSHLVQLPLDDAVHGYVRGRSIWTNLAAHMADEREGMPLAWYGFDIADAFPSVSHRWILRVLRRGFPTLSRASVGMLLNLVTYRPHLDQGYPTSPTLFNLALRPLDEQLRSYCAEHKIVYTRYADDFTFSSTVDFTPQQKRTLERIASNWPYKFRIIKHKEAKVGEYFEVTHRSVLRFCRRRLRDSERGVSMAESIAALQQSKA